MDSFFMVPSMMYDVPSTKYDLGRIFQTQGLPKLQTVQLTTFKLHINFLAIPNFLIFQSYNHKIDSRNFISLIFVILIGKQWG